MMLQKDNVFKGESLQNQINRAFSHLQIDIDAILEGYNYSFLGYDNSSIVRRLGQLITNDIFIPFIESKKEDYSKKKYGDIILELDSSIIRPTVYLWLYNVSRFIVLSLLIIVRLFPFTSKTKTGKYSIMNCFGFEKQVGGSKAKHFEEFCNEGPLKFLNESNNILIGSDLKDEYGTISYVRNPIYEILKDRRVRFHERFQVALSIIVNNVIYLYFFSRYPILSLLYRDIAIHPLLNFLNNKKLIEYYLDSNSNYNSQLMPLVSLNNKSFIYGIYWYSTNSVPFQFEKDIEAVNFPPYRYYDCDISYVWNDFHAEWLNSIENYSGRTEVTGPVLFNSNNDNRPNLTGGVLVFDVIPCDLDWLRKYTYLRGTQLYTFENCRQFLIDIIESTPANKLLSLKSKRGNSDSHDMRYWNFIETLAKQQQINLLEVTSDLYRVIKSADAVISMPFTSTAYIAQLLGVPSAYYDPTGKIKLNQKIYNTEYINNIDELKLWLKENSGKSDIHFREACLNDARCLFEWRNDPETRQNSFNKQILRWDEHHSWFKKQLDNNERLLYLAIKHNDAVGMIRLDKMSSNSEWEISWTIAPLFRERGIGKEMLKAAVNKIDKTLIARILKGNTISEKIAANAGFIKIDDNTKNTTWALNRV